MEPRRGIRRPLRSRFLDQDFDGYGVVDCDVSGLSPVRGASMSADHFAPPPGCSHWDGGWDSGPQWKGDQLFPPTGNGTRARPSSGIRAVKHPDPKPPPRGRIPVSRQPPPAARRTSTAPARRSRSTSAHPIRIDDGGCFGPAPPIPRARTVARPRTATVPLTRARSRSREPQIGCPVKVAVCIRIRPPPLPGGENIAFIHRAGDYAYGINGGKDPTAVKWRLTGDHQLVLINGKNRQPSGRVRFEFDRIFGISTPTDVIYCEQMRPIVLSLADDGFNGCIFAYGQTNSGKSWTIFGDQDHPGIIPLAAVDLLEMLSSQPTPRAHHHHHQSRHSHQHKPITVLRVSFMEIYCEKLRDLLTDEEAPLQIVDKGDLGTSVLNLTRHTVHSLTDVLSLFARGESARMVGANHDHTHASRSHAIFSFMLERTDRNTVGLGGVTTLSTLAIVDLAGSENSVCVDLPSSDKTAASCFLSAQEDSVRRHIAVERARGEREGINIRKSLIALVRVVRMLSEADQKRASGGFAADLEHIPYRDSKLTRILRTALGGNSNTAIVCTINPLDDRETCSTLRFAKVAEKVVNYCRLVKVPADICDPLRSYERHMGIRIARNNPVGGGGGAARFQMMDECHDHSSASSASDCSDAIHHLVAAAPATPQRRTLVAPSTSISLEAQLAATRQELQKLRQEQEKRQHHDPHHHPHHHHHLNGIYGIKSPRASSPPLSSRSSMRGMCEENARLQKHIAEIESRAAEQERLLRLEQQMLRNNLEENCLKLELAEAQLAQHEEHCQQHTHEWNHERDRLEQQRRKEAEAYKKRIEELQQHQHHHQPHGGHHFPILHRHGPRSPSPPPPPPPQPPVQPPQPGIPVFPQPQQQPHVQFVAPSHSPPPVHSPPPAHQNHVHKIWNWIWPRAPPRQSPPPAHHHHAPPPAPMPLPHCAGYPGQPVVSPSRVVATFHNGPAMQQHTVVRPANGGFDMIVDY